MKKTSNNDLKSTRSARSGSVGYTTVANAMPATREVAPYLGQTHVAGSYTQDDVANRIAASKGAQCGAEEVKRVLNAVGNYLLDWMPDELCSIDIGFAHVRPAIGGQFPSMDAAFDEGRNRIYVSATPSAEIRDALSSGAPTRMDDLGDEPKVGNVTWNDESHTIKSGEPFTVLGNALTLDVGDESAVLKLPKNGGSVPVTLAPENPGDWQRLVGRLDHAVDACEGAVLVVRTHGYDRESSLKGIPSNGLVVLAGAPPVPATVVLRTAVTEGMMGNNIRLGSEPITLEGENLTLGEGDKLYARNADYSDDDYVEIPSRFVSRNTATAIDLSEDSGDSLWAWLGEEVEFSEEHGRITFKLVSHGGVPSSEPQTVTVTAVVQFA